MCLKTPNVASFFSEIKVRINDDNQKFAPQLKKKQEEVRDIPVPYMFHI